MDGLLGLFPDKTFATQVFFAIPRRCRIDATKSTLVHQIHRHKKVRGRYKRNHGELGWEPPLPITKDANRLL
jgi:hypothetical protein